MTVQLVPETELQPDQPLNTDPGAADGVSTTLAPYPRLAPHPVSVQLAHATPPTVPSPPPTYVRVSGYAAGWNVAVTERAEVIATLHVGAVPLQPFPDQPVKSDPSAGVAARSTVAPLGCVPLQPSVEPVVQASPPPVTVPLPFPAVAMASGYAPGSNRAPTVFAEFIVNEQVAVPVHVIDHPLNSDPPAGAAESVTAAPFATVPVHPVSVHASPDTPLTEPAPAPAYWIVRG